MERERLTVYDPKTDSEVCVDIPASHLQKEVARLGYPFSGRLVKGPIARRVHVILSTMEQATRQFNKLRWNDGLPSIDFLRGTSLDRYVTYVKDIDNTLAFVKALLSLKLTEVRSAVAEQAKREWEILEEEFYAGQKELYDKWQAGDGSVREFFVVVTLGSLRLPDGSLDHNAYGIHAYLTGDHIQSIERYYGRISLQKDIPVFPSGMACIRFYGESEREYVAPEHTVPMDDELKWIIPAMIHGEVSYLAPIYPGGLQPGYTCAADARGRGSDAKS